MSRSTQDSHKLTTTDFFRPGLGFCIGSCFVFVSAVFQIGDFQILKLAIFFQCFWLVPMPNRGVQKLLFYGNSSDIEVCQPLCPKL